MHQPKSIRIYCFGWLHCGFVADSMLLLGKPYTNRVCNCFLVFCCNIEWVSQLVVDDSLFVIHSVDKLRYQMTYASDMGYCDFSNDKWCRLYMFGRPMASTGDTVIYFTLCVKWVGGLQFFETNCKYDKYVVSQVLSFLVLWIPV